MDHAHHNQNHLTLLPHYCAIAKKAGALIMRYFHEGFETQKKLDKSPVTEADIAANQLIINELTRLSPHIPIIAEEDEIVGREDHAQFFLVDPLDGTRSFVRRETEFTVNIGLIENGRPVLGVLYVPAEDVLYYGMNGHGAFKQTGNNAAEEISVRPSPAGGLTIFRSRTEPGEKAKAFLDTIKIKELISSSSSIKFCKIAEGSADLYPRFGRTMEWDTAAGHAILNAAGGRVETFDGKELTYGKRGFENPHFIALGG